MKEEHIIIILSIVAGLSVWVLDAILDALFFYGSLSSLGALFFLREPFLNMLLFEVPKQKLYLRIVVLMVFIIFGMLVYRTWASHKRLEEVLERSKERGRERSFDLMYIGEDVNGGVSHVSPSVEWVLGYRPEEVTGRSFQNFLPKSEIPKTVEVFTGVLKGENVTGYNTRMVKKDGSIASVEINSFPLIINGEVAGFQGTIIDITEHKQMKEEIRSLAKFLSENPNPVLRLNRNGIIRYANEAGQGILQDWGCKVGSIAPKFWQDTVYEALTSKSSRIINVKHSKHIYSFFVAPVMDAGYVNLYGRDITEQKKVEEKLRRTEAAYKLMEMKDKFISVATHELRTPLVSIKGYVDYILSGKFGPVTKKIKSSLQVTKRNTDRLLSLTNDLLDIRRFESGKLQLNLKSLDLREIIDHSIKEVQPSVNEKKQKLQLGIPDGSLKIQGDSIRLSQVIMNLLSNATKFTPEHGKIELDVKRKKDAIQVQISDTGIGIKKEELERVFEPFAAIEKPSYIKGTGLGLSVTKGLVEAHGGKIWAHSEGVGKGSTFTFTLPKRKE